MKRLLLLFVAAIAVAVSAAAQSTVSGQVVSADDNEPIIGATVAITGTSVATVTDVNGRFTITKVPAGATTVTVNYVGMVGQTVTISPNMVIALQGDANQLDEVVVTGYGSTRKAAFTGAASVVGPETIEKNSDFNFVKSLEGAVTGFTRNTSTSMPGQWSSVFVRGMGSLSSSSQPLYVVDGIPVNSTADNMYGSNDDNTNNNSFDPMAAYNPNDIESVTVLKDAAATAIYGSRAANGVIVITTKKGGNSKFQLNLEIKQGLTAVANNNMKYANASQTMDLFARGFAARYGYTYDEAYDYLANSYFGWDGVSSYNWADKVTRTAYFQEYNVSFNGTNGGTNYFASLNYTDNDGVIINSSNMRYGGRLNIDTTYKWFMAGVNASYSYSKNNAFSQSTSGSFSNPMVSAVTNMDPFTPFYTADGQYAYINYYNPLAVNDEDLGDLNQTTNQTINMNPWLRVSLPYGIWIKTNFGANIIDQSQYNYWSAVYNPQGMDYNGLGQKYDSRHSTLTWTNTIGWDWTFNKVNDVSVLLGQEMQRYDMHYTYVCGMDFPFADSGMRDLATAGSWSDSEYYAEESRLASYFIDAHYAYDNRYYLSASFRRDGSSVFGSDKRWGNFWSVGAKWRMSQEKFFEPVSPTITNAALRISYGTVGNQALPSLYASRGYYTLGYNYNGVPGMVPAQVANPDLSWETSRKFDVGFDLSFINRVHMTFDFYNEDTSDALYSVPVSMTTGFSSVYKNIGKMRNTGIEYGINATVFTNKDIAVNVFGNLTWNKNRVVKLADGAIEGTYRIIEEGHPYYQFYMKEYAGVNKENGKPMWYLNEEGDETTEDYTAAAKRYVGSADPKVYGAFGVSFRGYGFDASAQFNYRIGGKVYDAGARFTGRGMSFYTPLEDIVKNSWTEDNPNAEYPQYIYGDPYYATQTSSRWLMNGSYLRFSNLTIGYTLPQKITRKACMEKVRFFTNFDNIHTWTASSFTGYNPDTYANGVIAFQYPAVFTFTGGVQITF